MIEDIDYNAAGITVIVAGVTAYFLLADPLEMGMAEVSLWGRIIGLLVGSVLSYFVAERMINQ